MTTRRFSLTENWTRSLIDILSLTEGSLEVNDSVIILEHIHLLDVLKRLDAELLNGRLKLLVLVDILHCNMLLLSSLGA